MEDKVRFSQDAAIVLALASTAVHYAGSPHDEAERWLRALRLHGQVGDALQSLGVGEAPLETAAQPEWVRRLYQPPSKNVVRKVATRSMELAAKRGATLVGTVDILFALLDIYGKAFERALYVRGTSRDELVERLIYSTAPAL